MCGLDHWLSVTQPGARRLAVLMTSGQGRVQDLGLEGAKSSAEGARIEAPKAPRVYGVRYGEGMSPSPLGCGGAPSPEIFFIF